MSTRASIFYQRKNGEIYEFFEQFAYEKDGFMDFIWELKENGEIKAFLEEYPYINYFYTNILGVDDAMLSLRTFKAHFAPIDFGREYSMVQDILGELKENFTPERKFDENGNLSADIKIETATVAQTNAKTWNNYLRWKNEAIKNGTLPDWETAAESLKTYRPQNFNHYLTIWPLDNVFFVKEGDENNIKTTSTFVEFFKNLKTRNLFDEFVNIKINDENWRVENKDFVFSFDDWYNVSVPVDEKWYTNIKQTNAWLKNKVQNNLKTMYPNVWNYQITKELVEYLQHCNNPYLDMPLKWVSKYVQKIQKISQKDAKKFIKKDSAKADVVETKQIKKILN